MSNFPFLSELFDKIVLTLGGPAPLCSVVFGFGEFLRCSVLPLDRDLDFDLFDDLLFGLESDLFSLSLVLSPAIPLMINSSWQSLQLFFFINGLMLFRCIARA